MAEWERTVDLMQYYPDYLKEIRELKEIAAANKEEILKLYEGSDSLWKDGFIEDAGYQGIKRWESLLGIKPYPEDSLSERRAAVMGQWNRQLPYTTARLEERLLAVLGEFGYELHIRSRECELELLVTDQMYRVLQHVRGMVREMIPANLLFVFAGKYPVHILVCMQSQSRLKLESSFYPRYNQEYLKLDGGWILDHTYRLNGYKERKSMEFYPASMQMGGAVCGKVSPELNLTVEKDLWRLDGDCQLDGTKILDAEIIKYSL